MPNDKLTPTGRFPREPNIQNIPGSLADKLDKAHEAGLIDLGARKSAALGEIYKVQRPIQSNAPLQELYVYNEDQSFRAFIPATADVLRLFPKGVVKIYVYAKPIGSTLSITGRAPTQSW